MDRKSAPDWPHSERALCLFLGAIGVQLTVLTSRAVSFQIPSKFFSRVKMAHENLLEFARNVFGRTGWLSRQPEAFRELVFDCAKVRRVPAKSFVYRQGDPPTGIYGVASGCLKMEALQEDGRRLTMSMLLEGAWFGEISTIEGGTRPSSMIAVTDAIVLQIPAAAFFRIAEEHPRYLLNFASLLSDKVRSMHRILEELSSPDPTQRVLKVLLWLAGLRQQEDLAADIAIQITQEQLAGVANLSRQTVNHAIKDLKKAGMIDCVYGAVILLPKASPSFDPSVRRTAAER